MKYSVKWVEDNLGITRSAIKYYESKKLISKSGPRNPVNNYREFTDEDIDRLWGIKILQGMGFSVSEIYNMINDANTEFYTAIAEKVKVLKDEVKEKQSYLEFAKSIKLTGRVPTTSEIGSITYSDFIEYAHDNWRFCITEQDAALMDLTEQLVEDKESAIQNMNEEQLHAILEMIEDLQKVKLVSYFEILAGLRKFDYKNDVVQTIVKMLYDSYSSLVEVNELQEDFTKEKFSRNIVCQFVGGSDLGKINEENFGKASCDFIAKAIVYFGGYENIDDL